MGINRGNKKRRRSNQRAPIDDASRRGETAGGNQLRRFRGHNAAYDAGQLRFVVIVVVVMVAMVAMVVMVVMVVTAGVQGPSHHDERGEQSG
jgi:hypothetical protein